MSSAPASRGYLYWATCAAFAVVMFTLFILLPVRIVVSHYQWEASKYSRVREAVTQMQARKSNRLFLYAARDIDAQLEQIRGMPEIEDVDLEGTDITAVGMRHIGTLPNLKRIVAYEAIGDEGLLELRNCKMLESVVIYDRSITDEAISELQNHLPNARIGTRHDDDLEDLDRQPE